MINYKYISFPKGKKEFEIVILLEKESKEGWEVVSHSHNKEGISVILKKDDGLTN